MMFIKRGVRCSSSMVRSGFSLIELLVAIAIMGLILAIAVPAYRNLQKGAKIKTAKQSIKMIQQAVEFFELDVGRVPQTINDLVRRPVEGDYYDAEMVSNWAQGGYIKGSKIPKDPWKNKFQYKLKFEGKYPYELYSYGPNGKRAPRKEWIKAHSG